MLAISRFTMYFIITLQVWQEFLRSMPEQTTWDKRHESEATQHMLFNLHVCVCVYVCVCVCVCVRERYVALVGNTQDVVSI